MFLGFGAVYMFGFFKKGPSLNRTQITMLQTMAGIVDLNLVLLRSSDNFGDNLRTKIVRGYLMGFFDACLWAINQRPKSQEEYAIAMLFAHQQLLGDYVEDPAIYCGDSVIFHESIAYQAGQAAGAEDCLVFLNGDRGVLIGLARCFGVLRDK